MRLFERYFELIIIAPLTAVMGTLGSKVASFGASTYVNADVQPISSDRIRAEYGERADRIRQMFMPLGTVVHEGDGVWLAGELGASPLWRVISVANWKTHVEARIERRDAIGL
jgi:hypothetical protein